MFELTDTQLAEIAGGILFIALPSLIAAIADPLLRNVSRAALMRALWTALGGIGVGVLLLLVVGPRAKADPTGALVNDIGAGLAVTCFIVAIITGLVFKIRNARTA